MAEVVTQEQGASQGRLTSRQRWAIAGLVLAVAVFRVALVLVVHDRAPERAVVDDTAGYVDPARSLLDDGDFDHQPGTEVPEFVRTPGYPVFVAAAWFVSGDSTGFLLAVQAALGSLAVLFVILLGLRLTRSFAVAYGAGVLVAVDPLQNAQSGLIVTETIATALTTLALYLGARFVDSGFAIRWGAVYATVLAAATYVRPATYYFWIAVVLVLGFLAWRAVDRRAGSEDSVGGDSAAEAAATAGATRAVGATRAALGRAAVAVALPSVVLLGAWNVRNHFAVDSWRYSGVEAVNLYWYKAGALEAADRGQDLEPTQVELTEELNHDVPPFDYEAYRDGWPPPAWADHQGEYYARAHSEAMRILLDDPVGSARLVARGVYGQVVQSGWRSAWLDVAGGTPPRVFEGVGLMAVWVTEALAVVGAAVALRRRGPELLAHLLTLGLVGYVVLASSLGPDAAGGYRFRSPLWPAICLYAAIGAAHLWTRWQARRSAAAAEPTAAAGSGQVEAVDAG